MRHLANFGIDQLLNFLFGWRNDVKALNFLICTEDTAGNEEVLERMQISIDHVQREKAFSYLIKRIYEKYFWFNKEHITRFVVYLSTTINMQDGSWRYLPFIGFKADYPEKEMDKVVGRWHGKYVVHAQGFFISMDKFNPFLSGVYYLPIGLLFKNPLNQYVSSDHTYSVSGKKVKAEGLITVAILDHEKLLELQVVGDFGGALPSYLLEGTQKNNQLDLFVLS